jgi:hypothetical protein
MHEGVLVTDDVPGRPPCADVFVGTLRHKNVAETATIGGITFRIELEPVHVLHVPGDRSLAAVDFKGVAVATPRRVAGRLDRGEGPVFEFSGQKSGALDLDFAGQRRIARERTLGDELFPPAVDLGKFSDEKVGKVDRMGTEIPERTGCGGAFLQFPVERDAAGFTSQLC